MTSSLIALGDTLGLYKKMKELGQLSSAALAEACGLSERFVREWLHQQEWAFAKHLAIKSRCICCTCSRHLHALLGKARCDLLRNI